MDLNVSLDSSTYIKIKKIYFKLKEKDSNIKMADAVGKCIDLKYTDMFRGDKKCSSKD